MSKTSVERIQDIANKLNIPYESVKMLVYSNYGNNRLSIDKKLDILENL